jgi:hypothetical protein
MKISTVFIITTVVLGFFGLGGLFLPRPILGIYGLEGGDPFIYAVRIASAANISLSVMSFMARNASPSKARDAMLLGLTIYAALQTVLALIATLNGTTNIAGWSNVGMFAILTVLLIIVDRSGMQPSSA